MRRGTRSSAESDSGEVSKMVDEFFRAGNEPVSTHHEWLLHLASQLMQREASVVSVLERRAREGGVAWRTSSQGSEESTEQSKETGDGSSAA